MMAISIYRLRAHADPIESFVVTDDMADYWIRYLRAFDKLNTYFTEPCKNPLTAMG